MTAPLGDQSWRQDNPWKLGEPLTWLMQWKEQREPVRLSSDFHIRAVACAPVSMHTHTYTSRNKNKTIALSRCVYTGSTVAKAYGASKPFGKPAGTGLLQPSGGTQSKVVPIASLTPYQSK